MLNFLQVGKLAPNFLTIGVFKNQLGRIRLSDYRGKKYVILIFYPANFQKLSSQLLAISIDTPFSHLQFLVNNQYQHYLKQLQYPLISDLTQTIANRYRLLTDDGLCLPGVFIIDKDGIIQYYTVNNLLCGRNISEILRILRSIQFLKKNPGQVCPADWGTYR